MHKGAEFLQKLLTGQQPANVMEFNRIRDPVLDDHDPGFDKFRIRGNYLLEPPAKAGTPEELFRYFKEIISRCLSLSERSLFDPDHISTYLKSLYYIYLDENVMSEIRDKSIKLSWVCLHIQEYSKDVKNSDVEDVQEYLYFALMVIHPLRIQNRHAGHDATIRY